MGIVYTKRLFVKKSGCSQFFERSSRFEKSLYGHMERARVYVAVSLKRAPRHVLKKTLEGSFLAKYIRARVQRDYDAYEKVDFCFNRLVERLSSSLEKKQVP